ncbi:MAG: PKD domain-containing protein [Chloroflexota bacterium]
MFQLGRSIVFWQRPFRLLSLAAVTLAILVLSTVHPSTSAASLLSFSPTHDAHTKSSSPTSNYGNDSTVRLRAGSPTYNGYFQFAVTGVTGSISQAKLRLYVKDGSPDVGTVYLVDNGWDEATITWENAPALTGSPLGSLGSVGNKVWVEVDVTAVISTNGTYSFGLTSSSTNSTYFDSREGSNPPQLVLTVDDGPPPPPQAPVAAFNANITSGNAPLLVNFSDQSSNTPTSWAWDFGDGSTSTSQNPSHNYTSVGVYTVELTVSNSAGSDGATKTDYITVTEAPPPAPNPPVAAFRADVTSGDAPLTVNFTDESSNSPTSWAWEFGDGSTSTSQNPSHIYTTAGTYTVVLTAANSDGSDGETKTNYITVTDPPPPSDNLTFAPLADAHVKSSSATSNYGSDSQIRTRFGSPDYDIYLKFAVTGVSGSVSQAILRLFVTDYSNDGGSVYLVGNDWQETTITAQNAPVISGSPVAEIGATTNGQWVEVDLTAVIPTNGTYSFGISTSSTNSAYYSSKEGNNPPQLLITQGAPVDAPTAAFTADVTSGETPLQVSFTDESTNSPTSWAWDFGDGNTSTSQNPVHTYTSAGTYTVELTVTNAGGNDTETKTDYITVTDPPPPPAPVAAFVADVTSGNAPLQVSFTDESTNSPTSWAWEFGDGNTSTSQNPNHSYTVAGTYTVKLTVTNGGGSDSKTRTDYITVTDPPPPPAPVAAFTANVTSGETPLQVSFTDESSNTPTSWAWEFGDGNTSTSQNPNHSYTVAGTYTVKLTVTNGGGSDSKTRTDYITVTDPPPPPAPVANFSANVTSGNAPLQVNFSDQSSNTPTSWAWDFGDGATSTSQNPSHNYTTAGTYTVALTVTNASGNDTETKTDYITVAELPPPASHIGMWISLEEIAALPASGPAWDNMKAFADSNNETPDLSNQDSDANVATLARALVYAKTGDTTYLTRVLADLAVVTYDNTESGGRTLALGRELAAYVIAADIIALRDVNPTLDTAFRAKLQALLNEPLGSGDATSLVTTHELRGNNWGTHAGASRAAIALYLGDTAELARVAQVFKGWLGDRDSYAGFNYKDTDWYCDPANPTGVNPVGCERDGHSIDGALPEEMRRGGSFAWPPKATGYAWEGMQGAVVQAELLSRAGYPAWEWSDQALLRAGNFLYSINWPAESDDKWQPWLLNHAYGAVFVAVEQTGPGKNMGWTAWTHPPAPPVAPVAEFTADVVDGQAPLLVAFTDLSHNLPAAWSWDFGDGQTSTERHPTHTYLEAGTYTVKLTASNTAGSDVAEKVDYITVTPPPAPTAVFSANKQTGIAPLTVTFTDLSENAPTSWAWDFGDGGTASVQNPVHTYNTPGVYTVVLEVANATGSDTATEIDYIEVVAPPPPTAAFHANFVTGVAPLTVTFSDDSTGNPTDWFWNFGDGGNATQQSPQHIYTTPGVYTVSLLVTNSEGNDTLTKTDYIVVTDAPTSQTFAPTDDAHVKSSSPTSSYGSDSQIRTRFGSPDYDVYLKFAVTGVSGAVQKATLRLYVADGSDDGGTLYLVSNDYLDGSGPWLETGLTFANAPAITGLPVDSAGTTSNGSWIELDVTAVINGSGSYSFALTSNSTNSNYYSSKEGSNPPELIIEN